MTEINPNQPKVSGQLISGNENPATGQNTSKKNEVVGSKKDEFKPDPWLSNLIEEHNSKYGPDPNRSNQIVQTKHFAGSPRIAKYVYDLYERYIKEKPISKEDLLTKIKDLKQFQGLFNSPTIADEYFHAYLNGGQKIPLSELLSKTSELNKQSFYEGIGLLVNGNNKGFELLARQIEIQARFEKIFPELTEGDKEKFKEIYDLQRKAVEIETKKIASLYSDKKHPELLERLSEQEAKLDAINANQLNHVEEKRFSLHMSDKKVLEIMKSPDSKEKNYELLSALEDAALKEIALLEAQKNSLNCNETVSQINEKIKEKKELQLQRTKEGALLFERGTRTERYKKDYEAYRKYVFENFEDNTRIYDAAINLHRHAQEQKTPLYSVYALERNKAGLYTPLGAHYVLCSVAKGYYEVEKDLVEGKRDPQDVLNKAVRLQTILSSIGDPENVKEEDLKNLGEFQELFKDSLANTPDNKAFVAKLQKEVGALVNRAMQKVPQIKDTAATAHEVLEDLKPLFDLLQKTQRYLELKEKVDKNTGFLRPTNFLWEKEKEELKNLEQEGLFTERGLSAEKLQELKDLYTGEKFQKKLAYLQENLPKLLDTLKPALLIRDNSKLASTLSNQEKQIRELIKHVENLKVTFSKDGQLVKALDQLETMNPDGFKSWLEVNAYVLGTAVGSTVAVMTVFGAPEGVAGFLLLSAVMTGGGYLGQEIYYQRSGNEAYKNKFIHEALAGKLSNETAGQFLQDWATSTVFMALCGVCGRLAGRSLNTLAKGDSSLASSARSILNLKETFSRLTGENIQSGILSAGREFGQELGEEAAEEAHPTLGFLASTWNSMDGTNVNTRLATSYGITFNQATSSYDVKNFQPDGKVSVVECLQNEGFVASQNDGRQITLTRGDKKITLDVKQEKKAPPVREYPSEVDLVNPNHTFPTMEGDPNTHDSPTMPVSSEQTQEDSQKQEPVKPKTFADWKQLLPRLNGKGIPYPAEENTKFISWFVNEHFLPKLPALVRSSPTLKNLVEQALKNADSGNMLTLVFQNSYRSYCTKRVNIENGDFVKQQVVTIGKFNTVDLDKPVDLAKFTELLVHEVYHSQQVPRKTARAVWESGGDADSFAKEGVARELETMAYGYKVVNELFNSWGIDLNSQEAKSFGVHTARDGQKYTVLEIFKKYHEGDKKLAEEYCLRSTPGSEVANGGSRTYYDSDFIAFVSSIAGHLSINNAKKEDYERLYPDLKRALELSKKANGSVWIRTHLHAINVANKLGKYDEAIGWGINLHDLYERKIRDGESSLKTQSAQQDIIVTIGDNFFARKDYIKAAKEYSYALDKVQAVDPESFSVLKRISNKVYESRDLTDLDKEARKESISLAHKLRAKVNDLITSHKEKEGDPITRKLLISLHYLNGSLERDYFNKLGPAQKHFQEILRLDPNDAEAKSALRDITERIEVPTTFNLTDMFKRVVSTSAILSLPPDIKSSPSFQRAYNERGLEVTADDNLTQNALTTIEKDPATGEVKARIKLSGNTYEALNNINHPDHAKAKEIFLEELKHANKHFVYKEGMTKDEYVQERIKIELADKYAASIKSGTSKEEAIKIFREQRLDNADVYTKFFEEDFEACKSGKLQQRSYSLLGEFLQGMGSLFGSKEPTRQELWEGLPKGFLDQTHNSKSTLHPFKPDVQIWVSANPFASAGDAVKALMPLSILSKIEQAANHSTNKLKIQKFPNEPTASGTNQKYDPFTNTISIGEAPAILPHEVGHWTFFNLIRVEDIARKIDMVKFWNGHNGDPTTLPTLKDSDNPLLVQEYKRLVGAESCQVILKVEPKKNTPNNTLNEHFANNIERLIYGAPFIISEKSNATTQDILNFYIKAGLITEEEANDYIALATRLNGNKPLVPIRQNETGHIDSEHIEPAYAEKRIINKSQELRRQLTLEEEIAVRLQEKDVSAVKNWLSQDREKVIELLRFQNVLTPELFRTLNSENKVIIPEEIKYTQRHQNLTERGNLKFETDSNLAPCTAQTIKRVNLDGTEKVTIKVSQDITDNLMKHPGDEDFEKARQILYEELIHAGRGEKIIDPLGGGKKMTYEEYAARRSLQELAAESASESKFGGNKNTEVLKVLNRLIKEGKYGEAFSYAKDRGISSADTAIFEADYNHNTKVDRDGLVQRGYSVRNQTPEIRFSNLISGLEQDCNRFNISIWGNCDASGKPISREKRIAQLKEFFHARQKLGDAGNAVSFLERLIYLNGEVKGPERIFESAYKLRDINSEEILGFYSEASNNAFLRQNEESLGIMLEEVSLLKVKDKPTNINSNGDPLQYDTSDGNNRVNGEPVEIDALLKNQDKTKTKLQKDFIYIEHKRSLQAFIDSYNDRRQPTKLLRLAKAHDANLVFMIDTSWQEIYEGVDMDTRKDVRVILYLLQNQSEAPCKTENGFPPIKIWDKNGKDITDLI